MRLDEPGKNCCETTCDPQNRAIKTNKLLIGKSQMMEKSQTMTGCVKLNEELFLLKIGSQLIQLKNRHRKKTLHNFKFLIFTHRSLLITSHPNVSSLILC